MLDFRKKRFVKQKFRRAELFCAKIFGNLMIFSMGSFKLVVRVLVKYGSFETLLSLNIININGIRKKEAHRVYHL
jgi:hypothetical protein